MALDGLGWGGEGAENEWASATLETSPGIAELGKVASGGGLPGTESCCASRGLEGPGES